MARPKDRDQQDFLSKLLSGIIGAGIGGLWGNALGMGFVLGALLGGIIVVVLVQVVLRLSTRLVAGSLVPSGESTPRAKEYSLARSHLMREEFDAAIAVFEVHVLEDREDVEPYFAIAQVYKKQENWSEALEWYRRARADALMSHGQDMLALQEITELYIHKLQQPRKAIPELVQLSSRFAETPGGSAAKRELAAMRELLVRENDTLAGFTTMFLEKMDRSALNKAATMTREEMEREAVNEALDASGGDHVRAAAKLGIPLGKLEAAMKELGIDR